MKPLSERMLLGCAAASFVLVLAAQHRALADLFTSWQTAEYSHGPLIPAIALLFGWHRLIAVKPMLKPSWSGLAFLLVAALLQTIAALAAFTMAAQYGLIFAITGICLSCFGWQAFKALIPALVYLVFAVPLPHLLQADLSQNLQLISSSLGVWPLDAVGIPVYQEGNVIDLGGYKLQVVDACSGLRYLFPLMSFGYLVAMLVQDRWWKRVFVFLSTIPISILLNSLRITLIGVTVDRFGIGMARGFIHSFEGWTVFALCLLILMLETMILLRIGNGGRFRFDYVAMPRGAAFATVQPGCGPVIGCLFLSLLLVIIFSGNSIEISSRPVPPHLPLPGFPLELGSWHGQPDRLTPDILDALKLSAYWLANYQESAQQPPVNFYVAWYNSQSIGTTTHSPSNCIPGGGWEIEQRQRLTLPLPGQAPLTLTRLIIRKGSDAELVYYWFDERGRDLTETIAAKWYLLIDSLLMHRSDGALIRVATAIKEGESPDDAAQRLNGFLGFAVPRLNAYIPGAESN